ncbi:hypothetical protein [Streptomyces sp. NRRL F-5053]|uniref:hypothetical protein n=1 Tax=Streptomyces sp. NRRL F-5053 TaxID=1463854 RepID=UPI000B09C8AE|nr:hypothetical protein [Streptomyces sp. NRRL F-5053]
MQRSEDVERQKEHRGAGVVVLMRYTLRLLTAQQFSAPPHWFCTAEVLQGGVRGC